MLEILEQMLRSEYGIQALSLQEIPSGWSAAAWKVHSDNGDYFLKVYDKHKPSTKSWVARIDSYMPVVLWLNENTELCGRMTAPLLTKDGLYKREDAAFLYMVFPFINGQTMCNDKLKTGQVNELAQIVSHLHSYGAEIPVPTNSLRETFDVTFSMSLIDQLKYIHHSDRLKETLTPHIDTLTQRIEALQNAAILFCNSDMRFALCHTDIHGWNLMQSKSLILIDWEGLKLAPVEADLFSFTKTFFFEYAWDDFISIYNAAHKDYRVNPDALQFYRLRRRLEDIQAFTESVLFDNLTQDNTSRSLRHLKQECELL